MTPRKRKKSKATAAEEELPKIAVDLLDSHEAEITEEPESPEEPEAAALKGQEEGFGTEEDEMRQSVKEIQKKEGVIGYILRNSKSASIDLSDPSKVIDFAILSSSAFEACEELSSAFELGHIENVLIEGEDVKVLSVSAEKSKVSVFMETKANHNRIYKDLRG